MLYPQSWYLPALVALLVLHWVVLRGAVARKVLIIIASVALLASLQPWFTAALLAWTGLVYACGQSLPRTSERRRLRLLVFTIVALVGYLAFFKYLPDLLLAVFGDPSQRGPGWLQNNIVLPLGISYFTFRFLHYVIDAYRGQLQDHGLLDFVLYSVFFPIIPAGPIERLQGFLGNASDGFRSDDLAAGITRIIVGMAKKLVLVDIVLLSVIAAGPDTEIQAGRLAGVEMAQVWLFLMASFLYAYLDFSAYTDIAVGTSRLFGYRICENFRFPLFQRNLSEFWKRWHMSLSGWCRDYIYLPVLGRTRRPRLALYASMMTIGAWHSLSFNWLLWGALHATGLVCVMEWQRFARRRRIATHFAGAPGYALGMVLTFLYVSWVFAFVSIDSPVAAMRAFIFALTGQVPL